MCHKSNVAAFGMRLVLMYIFDESCVNSMCCFVNVCQTISFLHNKFLCGPCDIACVAAFCILQLKAQLEPVIADKSPGDMLDFGACTSKGLNVTFARAGFVCSYLFSFPLLQESFPLNLLPTTLLN